MNLVARLSFRARLTGAILLTSLASLALTGVVLIKLQVGRLAEVGSAVFRRDVAAEAVATGTSALILSAVVAYCLARAFEQLLTRPIDRMVDVTRAVSGSAEKSARMPVEGNDQFTLLARSFNDMLDAIARREAELEATAAELAEARDRALAADTAKSQFLANMSHELRTPLNAIVGYSEMLIEDLEGDEAVTADLQKIHRSAHHLLALINDILDLSKIEAGRVELEVTDVSVEALAEEVLATVAPKARERGNRLASRIEVGPAPVRTDAMRLRQCLLNLVSNAAKFTEDGVVTLTIEPDAGEPDEWLRVTVSDTGIGMTEDQVARLFQPFMQADASTTRKFGGTGLGLAITRRFLEILGAAIEVASTPGVGTTFTIRLPRCVSGGQAMPAFAAPAAEAAELPIPRPATPDDAPVVLVVDDEPSTRELMSRWLPRIGYRVEVARDGVEGVELARAVSPSVILLDVSMPRMNGWQALEVLRADEATKLIPTIMVTAHDDKRRAIVLGASDHMTKPIDRSELARVLALYGGKSTGRVLLVEDDPAISEMYARGIMQAGFEVDVAPDGVEALKHLRNTSYVLAIVDLMMPRMDGFELIERLDALDLDPPLPVMVVTAKELTVDDRNRLAGRIEQLAQKGGLSPRSLVDHIHRLTGPAETRRVA